MRHRTVTLFSLQVVTVLAGLVALASAGPGSGQDSAAPAATEVAALVNVRPMSHALHEAATPPPAPARPHRALRLNATHVTAVRHHRARPVASPVQLRAIAPRPAAASVRSPQQLLNQAIARIPGYRDSGTTWVLQANDGHWGTADWYHDVIWVSPSVPSNRMYDVAVHEWSHLKSVTSYAGNVDAAVTAMNNYFGGSGLTGAERAADCMARLDGATWTHYTDCNNSTWRAGAARLLNGQEL